MNIEKNRAALRRPRKLAARPGGRLERCLLMCGIVGYVGARCAQNVLLDGLTKLEYRGYDSAGLALSVGGGIRVIKSKGRLTALRARLEEATAAGLPAAHCGIGHTRWATHGEPSDVNSHPHSTPYVSIVHNGIIENYGALKAVLEAKGYTFVSETDTEVLVKLIDSCYHGEPLRALTQALARVRGSYALAVLFRDWPDTLFAVRRESPLIVGYGEGEILKNMLACAPLAREEKLAPHIRQLAEETETLRGWMPKIAATYLKLGGRDIFRNFTYAELVRAVCRAPDLPGAFSVLTLMRESGALELLEAENAKISF